MLTHDTRSEDFSLLIVGRDLNFNHEFIVLKGGVNANVYLEIKKKNKVTSLRSAFENTNILIIF